MQSLNIWPQVFNTKKPWFFYDNLTKSYMQQHNEVEAFALGIAIATVVTIAEIIKNNGSNVEKKILTSTVYMKDESKSVNPNRRLCLYNGERFVVVSCLVVRYFPSIYRWHGVVRLCCSYRWNVSPPPRNKERRRWLRRVQQWKQHAPVLHR